MATQGLGLATLKKKGQSYSIHCSSWPFLSTLITNQKRLFMLYDVQKAFMSLNDPQKMNSNDYSVTGIFSEIPVNRTRADFYMLPLTRCKCEGFDAEIPVNDNANDHMGLAELMLGI